MSHYSNSSTARVTNFLSFGDWVCPSRGDRKGQQAKVIGLYNLPYGQVATIEFLDGEQMECYASILVCCEAPPLLRCGKYALMRLWCPQTSELGEIEIGSDRYPYHEVDNASPVVLKCFRLYKQGDKKSDPDGHTCTILKSGQEDCTCGATIFGTGVDEQGRCKHLRAILALNLAEMPEEEDPVLFPDGVDPFGGVALGEIDEIAADHDAYVSDAKARMAVMVERCNDKPHWMSRADSPF